MATRRSRLKRRLVAACVLLGGLTLSVGLALAWRSSVRAHDRQVFAATASNATATLGTLLRRDSDFMGTLRAVLSMQFTVDALKIDRSFISSINDCEESTALIHTLVRLGKTLGLETVAEGIETSSQLQVLRRQRCDQGQGYLFARPLSADELDEFLAASPGAPAVTRKSPAAA